MLLDGQLAVDLAEVAVLAAREEQLDSRVLDHAQRAQFGCELRLF